MRDDVRIVLLGKTGVGKSATGNTILNRQAFISEVSVESVTSECQKQTAEINNRLITVIDTPGLFDTERSHEEIKREMMNCISMILPGPHVFIIVLSLAQRFTEEESTSVKIIQEMFGENSLMFTMVLFTKGDFLKNKTIEECLGKPGSVIRNLIEECGNRYHVFNNNLTEDQTQVSLLLEKIDDMVKANGGSYYSSKIFREMEREKHQQQIKKLMERIEQLSREKEEQKRQIRDEMSKERDTLKNEIEELKKENKNLLMKYETQTDKLMNTIENNERERNGREDEFKEREEQYKREIETLTKHIEEEKLNQNSEKKKREEEFEQREEKYKTEIKEKDEHVKEMRDEMRRERKENEKQRQEERQRREEDEKEKQIHVEQCEKLKSEMNEIMKEKERIERKKEDLQLRHEEEIKRLTKHTEEEKLNQDEEKKKREEDFRQREEKYKTEIKEKDEYLREMRDEMRRERETFKNDAEDVKRENKNLLMKYETQTDKLMNTIENHERERKRREDEFREKEERYNREIKEKEQQERQMRDEMRREREEYERQRQEEKQRREEDEKDKQIYVEQCEKLKSKMNEIIKEKERIEKEKKDQLEEFEKRIQEERNMREEQEKISEDKLKLMKEEKEEMMKEYKKILVYRRLKTEYNKWTCVLYGAMLEIENKLQNKIKDDVIHEIEERYLQRELKEKSEEVEKSMSEFFGKYKDQDILIQMKSSYKIKITELQESIIRKTKRKLNEILHQRDLKRKIDAQRTQHENILLEKSKELALKLKHKTNDEEILKREFDLFWKECVKKITTDTTPIKDIDILRDVKILLSDVYESHLVNAWMKSNENNDIFIVQSFSDYVHLKRSRGITGHVKHVYKPAQEKFVSVLSTEDEKQIRTLISDVTHETEKMIQSFNISNLGYNIRYIQQLTDYIKTRITDYEEESVNYEFKNEFFIDLVFSIFKRAEETFTDQHRIFRDVNCPVVYLEKKRDEYYRIFQKYCQGATSTVIYGEIICQKLKRLIEESVYRNIARDLADEIRSNCPSLNVNRSNLEKHILKRLAEEENFDKYMNYINNPRDHFKSLIRDEVHQYIRDQFSIRVKPKMNQNIQVLQQKILTAAHESTEYVQVKREDVDLWLKVFFTQKLSDVLIFSVKDFSGVKHDDVDDYKLLEDVMRTELSSIISEISREFSTDTFDVKLDLNNRPDEILINHLCQCCWVQCPFCKAICTNTIENHAGDHSVPFHRVHGINGTYYSETTNLSASICTADVVSNQYFTSDGKRVLYRDYRRAGGVYAKWSITPDLSELPYWKWFVCRFQKDLEKYYSKTFQGSGKIPDEWRQYTKQNAIECLDKYI